MQKAKSLLEKIDKLRLFLENEADKRDLYFNDSEIMAISVKLDELIAEYSLIQYNNLRLQNTVNF